ncbi:MAG: hypothetical protein IJ457_04980 [Clostridia bacterium]|nr:hypothetical protein [Clostridia bacterium]
MKNDTNNIKRRLAQGRSRKVFIVNTVLAVFVIGILVRSLMLGNLNSAFICLMTLCLFSVPAIIKRTFNVKLPETLEIIVLFFIFCAEILGELGNYYMSYPHWDLMLHSTWGFLCAALGFALVDIINQNDKIKFNLSPVYVAVVAFCFSMTVGVFWEFFEFTADALLGTDTQKDTIISEITSTLLNEAKDGAAVTVSGIKETVINGEVVINGYIDVGLRDTMEDLFVNFIGAFIFSIIGYVYIKHRGKNSKAKKFAERFIPTLDEEEIERDRERERRKAEKKKKK